MKDHNPFLQPGQWYKGALHLHTTRSDGRLSPAESVRFHSEHGYDFMAATDHGVITSLEPFTSDGFLTIPSVEMSYGHNELGQWGSQKRAGPGQAITEAEYRLKGSEAYVRVECIDAGGHAAWSNPIFV